MNEIDRDDAPVPPRGRRRALTRAGITLALTAGLMAGGYGIAAAATSSPSPSAATGSSSGATGSHSGTATHHCPHMGTSSNSTTAYLG
jgi:hypothetical protein